MTVNLREFSELLHSLYHANTAVEGDRHFLTQLKTLLNLQSASMIVIPPAADQGLIHISGRNRDHLLTQDVIETYSQFYTQDPLVNLPLNKVTTTDAVIPREEFLQSAYYQLFLKPINVYYVAGIDWLSEQGSRCSLRLIRNREQGDFNAAEKAFAELLIPHLEQAVTLGIRLRLLDSERYIYANTVSKRSIGIVTLNKKGRILKTNATAEGYLAEQDGIQRIQGQIKLSDKQLNDTFYRYIQAALTAAEHHTMLAVDALSIPRGSGKLYYQVVVKPLPVDKDHESDITPYVTVFIQDPEKNLEISVRTLINLYQLTPSEATVAILLAEGQTADEVAVALDIKKNTVRAHIRALFVKTGVSRQSMLVSLVLKSLATT